LPLAQEDVAKLGQPLAPSGSGLLHGRLLPGSGDFVAGKIEPPRVVLAKVVGNAAEGNFHQRAATLADDAVIRVVAPARSG